MARKKPRKLTRLRVDSVDVVDRGAGEGVKIMLCKRDGQEDDMDTILAVAKRVVAGDATNFTKADFYIELQKRAEADLRPGETSPAAFSRFSTTTEAGRTLLAANLYGPGPDYMPPAEPQPEPVVSDAYSRLMRKAAKRLQRHPELGTIARAFSQVYADPANRGLVAEDKGVNVQKGVQNGPPFPISGGKRAKLQRTVSRMIDSTIEALIASGKCKSRDEAAKLARRLIEADGRLSSARAAFA